MIPFVAAVTLAFGAVFVAEFGDKSQLLILAFATRHPTGPVVIGLVLGSAVISGLSVAVGAAVGAALPHAAVSAVAGVAFLGVAGWTLLGSGDGEGSGEGALARVGRSGGLGLIAAVAGTFVLGELGDKTMLATFAIAASSGPIPTWMGATLGMIAANLVAVAVGRGVGMRLSPRAVRIGSAALFATAGITVLAGVLLGAG